MARKLVTKGKKVSERKKRVQGLNPNAKKWVEALRSGKYRQGKNALATEDGRYCCLGVACELAAAEGVAQKVGFGQFDGAKFELPASVIEWLGLNDSCGGFEGDALCLMNDAGKRFKTIADVIESQPEGLFMKEVTA